MSLNLIDQAAQRKRIEAILANPVDYANEIESLRQQLSDSQNQVVMLRDALKYSMHQCEGLRVWGGMSWSYHPFQVKRIFDACEEALAATEPKP